MANQETAYGLRPIGMVGSGPNSTGITEYEIASGNTSVIYNGEICVPLASGYIDQAGDTAGGYNASTRCADRRYVPRFDSKEACLVKLLAWFCWRERGY